jgi:SAM-dependent methyltransferase
VDDVAPDGSPTAVYLALPAEPALGLVRTVVSPGDSVLDLGSGPGRIANPLADDGHDVVAVDDSAAMLSHVVGAEAVLADVWGLNLGRRFDVVLALSHLVNDRDRSRRLRLLQVCHHHLRKGGLVVLQRYPPSWEPKDGSSTVGEVRVRLHVIEGAAAGFSAAVTYGLRGRSWTQWFNAAVVDDEELASLALDGDLAIRGTLDDVGAWVVLETCSRG